MQATCMLELPWALVHPEDVGGREGGEGGRLYNNYVIIIDASLSLSLSLSLR